MSSSTAGTIVGLVVSLLGFGALSWLIIGAIVDEYRFHRDIAKIRAETTKILIDMRYRGEP